jgi:GxxExxY protein
MPAGFRWGRGVRGGNYSRMKADHDSTRDIIGAAISVHKALGPGLLERSYEKCMAYKLRKMGLEVQSQVGFSLRFEDLFIRDAYRVDLLVEKSIVVEVKAAEMVTAVHFAQVLTYLKATDLRVGLLINFNVPYLKDGLHRIVNKF